MANQLGERRAGVRRLRAFLNEYTPIRVDWQGARRRCLGVRGRVRGAAPLAGGGGVPSLRSIRCVCADGEPTEEVAMPGVPTRFHCDDRDRVAWLEGRAGQVA